MAPIVDVPRAPHAQALCEAAVTLADHCDAFAIVAITRLGNAARVLSALRPRTPIFAATETDVDRAPPDDLSRRHAADHRASGKTSIRRARC